MPVSEAQRKAAAKYLEKLDEIRIRMQKGRKDIIQAHAAAQGESVNGFINRAISQTMERDTPGSPPEAAGAHLGPGVVCLPSDTIKVAREAAEAEGEELQQFLVRAIEFTSQDDVENRAAGERAIEMQLQILREGSMTEKSRKALEETLIAQGIDPVTGDKLKGGKVNE